MKILVGSQAAKHWYPERFREPHDTDYFSDTPIENAETFFHEGLLRIWRPDYEGIALPSELYSIKVSHAFWDLKNGSWIKHMKDILWFQQNTRVIYYHDVVSELYYIWNERYGAKKAKLVGNAEDFFKNTVERVYDHDSIHHSVAYYDRPLFERILVPGEAVKVDKNRFDVLSHQDKLRLVREEVYATALERKVIPADYKYPAAMAYRWALQQTITSYSKGWFPLFIVLNFKDLIDPDIDYVQKHHYNAHKLIKL